MTAQGSGTKDDPWLLNTPPGSAQYTMYRDAAADPPVPVRPAGDTHVQHDRQ